jgi:hypothetical protein
MRLDLRNLVAEFLLYGFHLVFHRLLNFLALRRGVVREHKPDQRYYSKHSDSRKHPSRSAPSPFVTIEIFGHVCSPRQKVIRYNEPQLALSTLTAMPVRNFASRMLLIMRRMRLCCFSG